MIVGIAGLAGAGKSTVAKFIQKKYGWAICPMAEPVKRIAREVYGWDGEKDDRGRALLQAIGMTGRAYDEDFWVKQWFEHNGQYANAIIDDMRFFNEAEMVIAHDGFSIRLLGRGGLPGKLGKDATERDILKLPVAVEVDNGEDVSLEELEAQIIAIVEDYT